MNVCQLSRVTSSGARSPAPWRRSDKWPSNSTESGSPWWIKWRSLAPGLTLSGHSSQVSKQVTLSQHWTDLSSETSGVTPQWNFYKYLLDHQGNIVQVWPPQTPVEVCIPDSTCGFFIIIWCFRTFMTLSRELCTRRMMSFRWRVHSGHTMSFKWNQNYSRRFLLKMHLNKIC